MNPLSVLLCLSLTYHLKRTDSHVRSTAKRLVKLAENPTNKEQMLHLAGHPKPREVVERILAIWDESEAHCE